jgi:hypothetical protein
VRSVLQHETDRRVDGIEFKVLVHRAASHMDTCGNQIVTLCPTTGSVNGAPQTL